MNNKFGFSIIELMIAVGISGMAAVGVMQMTENQVKVAKKVNTEFDIDTLINAVQKVVINRDACNNTFRGRAINTGGVAASTPIPVIRGPGGAPGVALVQSDAGNIINRFGDLLVREINFIYRGDVENVKVSSGAARKKIVGDIEIVATRNSVILDVGATGSAGGEQTFTRRLPFPIEIVTDLGGNVVAGNDAGCIPVVKDIDQDVIDAFCLMITKTAGNASGNGDGSINCDTRLTGETPASLPPTPGPDGDFRVVSVQDIQTQVAQYQVANNNTDRNKPNILFNSQGGGSETSAKFVSLTINESIGNVQFSGSPGAVINYNPTNNSDVINVDYLLNGTNFARGTACDPGEVGLAGPNGVVCFPTNVGSNSYITGYGTGGISENPLGITGADCQPGQGVLSLAGNSIVYTCNTGLPPKAPPSIPRPPRPATCGGYADFDLCGTTCLGKPALIPVSPASCCNGYDTNDACE